MSNPSYWPVKHCEICGERLERRNRSNGGCEHLGEFLRRKTCGKACTAILMKGINKLGAKINAERMKLEASERMIGHRFGNIVVIGMAGYYVSPKGQSHAKYRCRCDCSRVFDTRGYHLQQGKVVSCPSCSKQRSAKLSTVHGCANRESLYTTWKGMRERCNNPKSSSHSLYYDRGIRICEEWNDYLAFRNWALSKGWVHGLTIDRIDPNKGYSPSNCRVVTMKVNNDNRVIGRDKNNGRYISIRKKDK